MTMVKLGLTGGPGTGKSTVAVLLAKQGLPVLDTDDLAREFTRPGHPILQEIAARFGPEMIDDRGALRRGALADRVFGDAAERQALEAILHPPIRDAWMRQLGEWREAGRPAGCVVIPLLYETACEREFGFVICAACTADSQRSRLTRRGWTDSQIDGRLAAQLPLKTKMERADFVIWTEGEMTSTQEQLDRVLNQLPVPKA